MGLAKTAEKLQKYFQRLNTGKAEEIKPSHVQRVIDKLAGRERDLLEEIAATTKPSKKQRLEAKLASAREQMERARWLLEKVS